MENRNEALNQMKVIQEKWKELQGDAIESLSRKFKDLSDKFWTKQKEFYEEQKWDRWANKENKNALIRIVEKTSEMTDLRKVAKIIREAQKKWKEYGPVPKEDSEPMWERFHKACEENYARCTKYFEELDKKRQENLEYCKKLVERAKEALNSEDLVKAVKDFKDFGIEWKEHSELPRPEGDELYKEFRKISDEFFAKYGEFRQEIDSNREENQKLREEIIEKIKIMVQNGEDDIKKCIALQKEMYALGPGLKEKESETRKAFREACDAFFESVDKNREKNIPVKEKICEEAEALISAVSEEENDPGNEIINKIYKLQREWRKAGPLPKKDEKTLWERFKNACVKILKLDLTRPPEDIKSDLAAKAEELSDSTQWRETTEKLRYFQIQWNLVSHTSDDEQWKRFRSACDKFFNRKKEHFEKADSEREKNLIEKEGLIARIEILAKEKHNIETETEDTNINGSVSLADELKIAIENNFVVSSISGSGMNEEIKRIQEQWKKIGFVPRDKDKDIWNRYRKALDMYYKGITPEKDEEQSVSKADQKEKEPSISEPEPSEQ
jgi:ubiquitin